VQKNLFPHLNECLKTPLTEQEQRLVSILEIVQIERHVSNSARRHCWRGDIGDALHIYTIDLLVIITEFISALFPKSPISNFP
ncbi:MAG: hypothetical protein BWK74_01425, partial [Desulfobacteraceae bacterium A6]